MRMIIKGILLGTLVISMTNCNYVRNVSLLSVGSVKPDHFQSSIPFTYRKKLIVIQPRLNNDDQPREFIFDTGAFNSKVENRLARYLGLTPKAYKSNTTAQGITRRIEVTQIDSVNLGGVIFKKIGAGMLVYDSLSASPCIASHGIIGANLIKLANWKIDYQSQKLEFSDSKLWPKKPDALVDFERPLLSGVPGVTLQVGEREVEGLLFDVGYNGGIVLPLELADYFDSPRIQKIYDRSTSGIYGSKADTLLIKNLQVSLGKFSTMIPVEFSALGKALIGNDFLEHFDVFIDNDENQIALINHSEVTISDPSIFIPGVLSDSLWVVSRVTDDIPLQLGDTLRTIGGQYPVNLYVDYCDYVLNISDKLKVDSLEVITLSGSSITIDSKSYY